MTVQFSYSGRTREGRVIEGILEAADSSAAAALLLGNGTIPIRIAEAGGRAGKPGWAQGVVFEKRFAPEELMHFCRQMHTLLRAGVPITRALAALHESAIHPRFGAALLDLRQNLESGRELSSAMQAHPRFFSLFLVSMVQIGEATGQLDEIFIRLFEHLEFQKEMDQRVKTATRYPSFVIAALGVALVIINLFVIPAFAGVYRSMHVDLPLITRLLVGFSDFTVQQWPSMLVLVVGSVTAFRAWRSSPAGRLIWDEWILRAPVIGSLLRKALLARFARSLAMALRCGMRITEALDAAVLTSENRYVQGRLERMRVGIDRGESLTDAARATGVFTPIVLQMLAVGEETGMVDELLSEVAGAYQSDVAYELKTLSDAIEPILIVALGGVVLLLALGVFLPMWDLGRVAMIKH